MLYLHTLCIYDSDIKQILKHAILCWTICLFNKCILQGKSPSRLSKTPEDENQNDTVSTEDQKPEKTKQKTEDDDDIW